MKPNAHYTEIAFILDRSGSMNSCQQAAIAGFNRFLVDQQKTEGLAKLTLVLFDDEYFVPVSSIPVQEVVRSPTIPTSREDAPHCWTLLARPLTTSAAAW